MALALYIHVPFCETKCSYCNFNTYERIERLIPGYLEAVKREAAYWGAALERPATGSIFFGGGTPSWLPPVELGGVLDVVRRAFRVEEDAEITAEVNPGDAAARSLAVWREAGINRLSFGVQSLRDDELTLLTRRHSAREAVDAVARAREAGFDNVSVDLIYGLPRQTVAQWEESLEGAAALGMEHLSLYALGVEEGTPLHRDVEAGRVPAPDPDLAAEMYELAERRLAQAGYEHYEISNWAKPGRESRHNLVYWENDPFVGLGPGAHSYLPPIRFWNIRPPAEYVRRLGQPAPLPPSAAGADERNAAAIGASPVVEERRTLDEAELAAETAILKLRLASGLAEADVPSGAASVLGEFEGYGMVERADGAVRLTPKGRLLSNELFARLLPNGE